MNINLERFLKAQETDYLKALAEIKAGKKTSHWMWYIFPQIEGLGKSITSKFYAIKDLEEATAYINHSILGSRLREISNELLKLEDKTIHQILNSPDDLKLKSSMTLFVQISSENNVFKKVLDKFFDGTFNSKTIEQLENKSNPFLK